MDSPPIYTLPPELVFRIMELAHEDPPSTLLSAALVCRRWRDPAPRELFGHVVINLLVHSLKNQAWIGSPVRERFAIRSLSLTARTGDGQEAEEILSLCGGLQSLILQRDYDREADPDVPDDDAADSLPVGWPAMDWGVLRLPSLVGEHLHLRRKHHTAI